MCCGMKMNSMATMGWEIEGSVSPFGHINKFSFGTQKALCCPIQVVYLLSELSLNSRILEMTPFSSGSSVLVSMSLTT